MAQLQKQLQEKQPPPTPNQHSSVGKQFCTNSSLGTARSEILAPLTKKRLLPWISVQPNFLSRSLESLSHSWLPRSRSTTERILAVKCCWNTGIPMPACCISSARAGLRQQQLQAGSAETFPEQKRDFSGLCALPICSYS